MVFANGINPDTWTRYAWRNRLQSVLLLLWMALFVITLGYLLWGAGGIFILLLIGITGIFLNPALSPWWVMRLYGARRITPDQAQPLFRLLGELSRRAGLEIVPDIYYVPSRLINAFAVGSANQAAIGLSDGLLRQLSPRELTGVLAHEISHIRGNDLWVMGLADLFSRATSMLSTLGMVLLLINLPIILFTDAGISWFAILILIFAPTLSALAQLALSRTREYDADLNAARLTGDPEGLARALLRIERLQGGWLERILLPGRRIPDPSLLRTHPPTEERIRRLMALQPADSLQPLITPQVLPYNIKTSFEPRSPRWHINGLWY